MSRIPFWLWLVGAVIVIMVGVAIIGIDPAYQFAVDVVAIAIAGIVLAVRRAARPVPQTFGQMDALMVGALYATTGSGPNDLLTGLDGRTYWVSTLRYPGAGWQTAVFDRSLPDWLNKPLFRINEMQDPSAAMANHVTALEVIARAPREAWPTGMHFEPCADPSWTTAAVDVAARLAGIADDRIKELDVYVGLRRELNARHL